MRKLFPSLENQTLAIALSSREITRLKEPSQWVGYNEEAAGKVCSVLLKNNGLHVEIELDKDSFIGKTNQAGIKDVILESALSAIQDCEKFCCGGRCRR